MFFIMFAHKLKKIYYSDRSEARAHSSKFKL